MGKRRLPDWMKIYEPVQNKNCNVDSTNSVTQVKNESDEPQPIIKKEKKNNASDAIPTKEENPPRRSLRSRSQFNKIDYRDLDVEAEQEKPKNYPYINYKGKINYLTTDLDIACASDELFQWVEKQVDTPKIPIAFDMEWPFSFQTGPGKSAVIQLCADENLCYVFHIPQLKTLPKALISLLNHPKVCLHGINIKNDFRKLARDFPEVDAEILIAQCVDLGPWCNAICNTGGRWSLERLVNYICKLQIDKNKKVRMSKWHIMPLDDAQKMYAAIDVYISQIIYRKLEKREAHKKIEEKKYLEEYGEKSLRAIKALGENFLPK